MQRDGHVDFCGAAGGDETRELRQPEHERGDERVGPERRRVEAGELRLQPATREPRRDEAERGADGGEPGVLPKDEAQDGRLRGAERGADGHFLLTICHKLAHDAVAAEGGDADGDGREYAEQPDLEARLRVGLPREVVERGDVVGGDAGRGGPQRAAAGGEGVFGRAAAVKQDRAAAERDLFERHVNGFARRQAEAGVLHVADDADDFDERVVRREAAELAADGAPAGPVFVREGLAHDGDVRRVGAVAFVDQAAVEQRNADRRKVVRRNATEVEQDDVAREFAAGQLREKTAAPRGVADGQGRRHAVVEERGFQREIFFERADELGALLVCAIGQLGKLQAEDDAMLRGEAEVHAAEFPKSEPGQRGAGEDEHGYGSLQHDHVLLPAERGGAEAGAARFAAQRLDERCAAGLQRRERAGDQAGAEDEHGGERERFAVEPGVRDEGGERGIRVELLQKRQREPGEQDAERAADGDEREALHEKLAHELPAGRAEREADGGFALALGGPRHEQRREVADRKDEQHGGASLHEEQRGVGAGEQRLAQRLHAPAPVLVGGVGFDGADGEVFQLEVGGVDGEAGREARVEEKLATAVARGPQLRGQVERQPHIGLLRLAEDRREHADDRVRRAVEAQRAAEDVGRSAERAAPQRIADDGDGRGVGALLFFREYAAEHGRHAHEREEIRRDARARQAARVGVLLPVDVGGLHAGDFFPEVCRVAQELVVGISVVEIDAAAAGQDFRGPDEHDAVGLGHAEAAEEKRLEDGEDGGVGAEGERHGGDDDGERGAAPREEPQRGPEVEEERVHGCVRGAKVAQRGREREAQCTIHPHGTRGATPGDFRVTLQSGKRDQRAADACTDDFSVGENQRASAATKIGARDGGRGVAPFHGPGLAIERDDAAGVLDHGAGHVLAGGAGENGVGGDDGRAPREAANVGGPERAAVRGIECAHAAEIGTANVERAVNETRRRFDPRKPIRVAPRDRAARQFDAVKQVVARADHDSVAGDDGRGDERTAEFRAQRFLLRAAVEGEHGAVETGGDHVVAVQRDGRVDFCGCGVAPEDFAGPGADRVEAAVGRADVEDGFFRVEDGCGCAVVEGLVFRRRSAGEFFVVQRHAPFQGAGGAVEADEVGAFVDEEDRVIGRERLAPQRVRAGPGPEFAAVGGVDGVKFSVGRADIDNAVERGWRRPRGCSERVRPRRRGRRGKLGRGWRGRERAAAMEFDGKFRDRERAGKHVAGAFNGEVERFESERVVADFGRAEVDAVKKHVWQIEADEQAFFSAGEGEAERRAGVGRDDLAEPDAFERAGLGEGGDVEKRGQKSGENQAGGAAHRCLVSDLRTKPGRPVCDKGQSCCGETTAIFDGRRREQKTAPANQALSIENEDHEGENFGEEDCNRRGPCGVRGDFCAIADGGVGPTAG